MNLGTNHEAVGFRPRGHLYVVMFVGQLAWGVLVAANRGRIRVLTVNLALSRGFAV